MNRRRRRFAGLMLLPTALPLLALGGCREFLAILGTTFFS